MKVPGEIYMKITCEKSELQSACTVTARAVASKSPIAALEGFLLEAEGDILRVTGYDLKRGIKSEIEANTEQAGKMVVNAKLFGEIIRSLPDGMVTITCDERLNVNLKCGRSEFNFSAIDYKDFPEMPLFDEIKSISIPGNILGSMIRKTIFAVSKEEIRPVYTGTRFEIEDGTLTLVSVDGYRLARRVEKLENAKLENCSFVVPGFALSDVEKICGDDEGDAVISIGDKHISFTIGKTVVISRRLEGDFLNHRNAVPESFRFEIEVDRQEIISVIDRVAIVLTDKNGSPVRLRFGNGSIDCSCTTPTGKAQDICLCTGNGEELEIGFNDRYILDALKNAEGEKVLLCLSTSSSPCVIKESGAEEEKYTYMVLPVRLHAN